MEGRGRRVYGDELEEKRGLILRSEVAHGLLEEVRGNAECGDFDSEVGIGHVSEEQIPHRKLMLGKSVDGCRVINKEATENLKKRDLGCDGVIIGGGK